MPILYYTLETLINVVITWGIKEVMFKSWQN
jgi:hypothetical protein